MDIAPASFRSVRNQRFCTHFFVHKKNNSEFSCLVSKAKTIISWIFLHCFFVDVIVIVIVTVALMNAYAVVRTHIAISTIKSSGNIFFYLRLRRPGINLWSVCIAFFIWCPEGILFTLAMVVVPLLLACLHYYHFVQNLFCVARRRRRWWWWWVALMMVLWGNRVTSAD